MWGEPDGRALAGRAAERVAGLAIDRSSSGARGFGATSTNTGVSRARALVPLVAHERAIGGCHVVGEEGWQTARHPEHGGVDPRHRPEGGCRYPPAHVEGPP